MRHGFSTFFACRFDRRRIAWLLAISVAWTFALAWLAMSFDQKRMTTTRGEEGSKAEQLGWPNSVDRSWPLPTDWAEEVRPAYRKFNVAHFEDDASPPTHALTHVEFGWPVAALYRTELRSPNDRNPSEWNEYSASGLRVAWSGAACSILAWVAVFGALDMSRVAWRMSRETVRLRRGLCPSCTHPLQRSEVCPECGRGSASV